MKPGNFSMLCLCALLFGIAPVVSGLTCWSRLNYYGEPKTVTCDTGSCYIHVLHGNHALMIGAGCGPKHSTGYQHDGNTVWYYCNQDHCNSFWTDDQQTDDPVTDDQQTDDQQTGDLVTDDKQIDNLVIGSPVTGNRQTYQAAFDQQTIDQRAGDQQKGNQQANQGAYDEQKYDEQKIDQQKDDRQKVAKRVDNDNQLGFDLKLFLRIKRSYNPNVEILDILDKTDRGGSKDEDTEKLNDAVKDDVVNDNKIILKDIMNMNLDEKDIDKVTNAFWRKIVNEITGKMYNEIRDKHNIETRRRLNQDERVNSIEATTDKINDEIGGKLKQKTGRKVERAGRPALRCYRTTYTGLAKVICGGSCLMIFTDCVVYDTCATQRRPGGIELLENDIVKLYCNVDYCNGSFRN